MSMTAAIPTNPKKDSSNGKDRNLTGYGHPGYARSLSEFGTPRHLPHCGGWILERQIPGFSDRDGMGCYPLFVCQDWSQLHTDLDNLSDELVSLALVTDPFGNYDVSYLQQCFDVVTPFKEHFVIDLSCSKNEIGSKRRRKYARRTLKNTRITVCQEPVKFLDTWVDLYSNLIQKHNIQGIRAFSTTSFAKQLQIPTVIVLQAEYEEEIIGAQIYFMQGDVVHCHLGAFNQLGYQLGASYALDWYSIEYFSGKARWLDLGGGVGIDASSSGLQQYKIGWSTDTRPVYFCGKVLQPHRYQEIVVQVCAKPIDYFPAYRAGEFT